MLFNPGGSLVVEHFDDDGDRKLGWAVALVVFLDELVLVCSNFSGFIAIPAVCEPPGLVEGRRRFLVELGHELGLFSAEAVFGSGVDEGPVSVRDLAHALAIEEADELSFLGILAHDLRQNDDVGD